MKTLVKRMPKFKGNNALSDMQAWLEQNIQKVLLSSINVENVLVETMIQAIWEVVYDAYEPEQYNRREDDGGLADRRNIMITGIEIVDGAIRLTVENLTYGNDSLRGSYITDTIEEGIKANWDNSNGAWAEPRPFIEETRKRLKENPTQLIEAVKDGLRKRGLKVK